MKYKYYSKRGDLLAESDSVIKFNLDLFPICKGLEPKVSAKVKTAHWQNKEEEK